MAPYTRTIFCATLRRMQKNSQRQSVKNFMSAFSKKKPFFLRPSPLLLLAVGLTGLLTGCGRKEDPLRPGDLTIPFPRTYPADEKTAD